MGCRVQGGEGVWSVQKCERTHLCIFCTSARRQVGSMKMLSQIKVPQYQHDEGVWECPQKVMKGVWQSSGGVRGVDCRKCECTLCAYYVLLQEGR